MPSSRIADIPIPAAASHVLFFGGSFDPPHQAHLRLASRARAHLPDARRTWLVLVPAARSPLKSARPTASDRDRLAMTQAAAASIPRCAVWNDELERADTNRPSYWIETLRRARRALGRDAQLNFILGADQAAALHRWRSPRTILRMASPVILPRAPLVAAADLRRVLKATGAWSAPEVRRLCGAFVPLRPIRASSTDIRALLGAGRDPASLSPRLLHPDVAAYIRANGMYEQPTSPRP